nr:HIT family protein [Brooklawnia cerclae]
MCSIGSSVHACTDKIQYPAPVDGFGPRADTARTFGPARNTGPVDVFDQIVAGDVPAEVIARNDRAIAFLDTRPLFPGHALVCPVDHYETFYDLPADLYAAICSLARRVALAQRDALDAEGTFLGNNNIVSQSVPHFHLHVVPRHRGDGLRGFFWPRTRPSSDELHAVGDRLRAVIEEQR